MPSSPRPNVRTGAGCRSANARCSSPANWSASPYVNYTLEVDDRIESPVVNLKGMDCWTYYENALAIARMLRYKPGPYKPQDMLHMVEIERYRNGVCTGSYLSRMHHLEEVFYDNQRRGYATNITPRLPGAVRLRREIREMTVQWKSYRYLRSNPALIAPMGKIEAQVSKLPVYHIPKSKVRAVGKPAPERRHLRHHHHLAQRLHLARRTHHEDQEPRLLRTRHLGPRQGPHDPHRQTHHRLSQRHHRNTPASSSAAPTTCRPRPCGRKPWRSSDETDD